MHPEVTRTLLVTNFPRTVQHKEIIELCKRHGEIRNYFTMHDKDAVLFITFYNIKSAEDAYIVLLTDKKYSLQVKYSIWNKEIPKGSDTCSEDKNQGSIAYTSSEEYPPENPKDVYESLQTGKERTIRFYDSRKALEHYKYLKKTYPRSNPRFIWDNDLRKRRTLLQAAEEIVKHTPIDFYSHNNKDILSPTPKRRTLSTESNKKVKQSNWLLSLFDKYIIDNAAEIAKSIY
ncbi:hypothetical protein NEOKW01_0353 [Nematocida sp. AWRm80]|nr:hypothetical protein NEOKW01_0353 [Nematocida sp. AWRm80]